MIGAQDIEQAYRHATQLSALRSLSNAAREAFSGYSRMCSDQRAGIQRPPYWPFDTGDYGAEPASEVRQ